MLRHLIVIPQGGLGNRLCAIASGIRACDYYHAKLTIVWGDGDLRCLLKLPPEINVVQEHNSEARWRISQREIAHSGREAQIQKLPLGHYLAVEVEVAGCFSGDNLPAFGPSQILPWLPTFAEGVRVRAQALREAWALPAKYWAMHIPQREFPREDSAKLIVSKIQAMLNGASNGCILLNCEDNAFHNMLKKYFPTNVIFTSQQTNSWEDSDYIVQVRNSVEDLAVLLLMAKARYVSGISGALFSELAIALNGSLQSEYWDGVNQRDKGIPRLSFCTTLHNRLVQLQRTFFRNLEIISRYSDLEWVILDWGSSDGAKEWILAQPNLPKNIHYVRQEMEGGKWHAPKIKNKAMVLGTGRWLMSLDADNFISENIVRLPLLHEGLVHNWSRRHRDGTYGRILIGREMFYYLGGFDESFPPMTGHDMDLINRAKRGFPKYVHLLSCERNGMAVTHARGSRKKFLLKSNKMLAERARQRMIRITRSGAISVSLFSSVKNHLFDNSLVKTNKQKSLTLPSIQPTMKKTTLISNKASYLSTHHALLRSEIERLNGLRRPVNVLEWSGGLSTRILCEELKKESTIIAIYHNENYCLNDSGFNGSLIEKFLRTQQPYGESENYITYPLLKFMQDKIKYDLIIVEGRNRADCLAIASLLLAPGGTVILHDAERISYQASFSFFRKVKSEIEGNTQTAILRDPIGEINQARPLSFIQSIIKVEKRPIPLNWVVCAVAIPRESYYWLKDWIEHHLKAGASKVVIYDNTGSTGSLRPKTVFAGGGYQKKQQSKRGEKYGELTVHLTDAQIRKELDEIAASFEKGRVEIVTWRPLNPANHTIVHGQVEAYCDFIRRHRDQYGWGAFLDLDEYLFCAPGLTVSKILKQMENELPEVAVIQMRPWGFECRWSENGPKNILELTKCRRIGGVGTDKSFVRLRDVTHANIHLQWSIRLGNTRIFAQSEDFGFVHYNQKPDALKNSENKIKPREFIVTKEDDAKQLRTSAPLPAMEHVSPLPVETTTVLQAG